ncbi:hypothetical protein JEP65_02280 [Proteus mirabilis]|nr:hypothetical protein [Proteus mirabilis]MBI6403139.1 hypothetical protein [Proteus mirabilis]HEJ9609040.1 hypothetical protein [Proteus mirabilis]
MSDDMSVDSEQNKEELIEFFEKEKEKNNSNFLSKTRILALSLIPGVKQLTQFRSDLIEYLDENEVLRLVEFFYGINYQDNPQMLQALGPEYAEMIINFVMKELEKNKINYYTNLILNISNTNYSESDRKNFLYILKNLTNSSIELMKYYYISSKYDLVGYKNNESYEHSIANKGIDFFSMNFSILRNYGLINQPTTFYSGSVVHQSLIQLSDLIFDKSTLTPDYIGEKEKEFYDVIFVKTIENSGVFPDILVDSLIKKGNTIKVLTENEWEEYKHIAILYISTRESGKTNINKKYIELIIEDKNKLNTNSSDKKYLNSYDIEYDYISMSNRSPIQNKRLISILDRVEDKIIELLETKTDK